MPSFEFNGFIGNGGTIFITTESNNRPEEKQIFSLFGSKAQRKEGLISNQVGGKNSESYDRVRLWSMK